MKIDYSNKFGTVKCPYVFKTDLSNSAILINVGGGLCRKCPYCKDSQSVDYIDCRFTDDMLLSEDLFKF